MNHDNRQLPLEPDHRAARGTLFIAAGRGCFYFLGYLTTVLLARHLGPGDYGVYGIVISVLVWMEQIGRYIFPPAAAKLIPEHVDGHVAVEQTAFFFNLILSFIFFAGLWIAAPLLAEIFKLPEGTVLFRLAALDLPIFGAYLLYIGVLQGRREFAPVGIADSVYSVVKVLGVLFFLSVWLSIEAALIANILASVGGLLFLMSQLSIKTTAPDRSLIRHLFGLALPFGLCMAIFQILGVLDLWALKALSPSDENHTIGVYVAARNISVVPSFVLVAVSEVLLPSLSRALAMKDAGLAQHYIQWAVRFLWIFVLPVTLLLALTGQELVALLFSDVYAEGGRYLAILGFSAAFLSFITLFASALNARGESLTSTIVVLVLVLLAALLNILVVPEYGAVGAASSSVAISLLGALTFGGLVYRRFGVLITLRTVLNSLIAALPLIGLASQVTVTGPLLIGWYIGCLGVYLGTLYLLREFTLEDLDLLPRWRWRQALRSPEKNYPGTLTAPRNFTLWDSGLFVLLRENLSRFALPPIGSLLSSGVISRNLLFVGVREAGFRALWVTLGLLLTTALVEAAFRLAPSLLPEQIQERVRSTTTSLAVGHPYIGHLQKPNSTGMAASEDFRAVYHTDRYGFRNEQPWPQHADIVAVGDSLTFGYGVRDRQTWPAIVGRGKPETEMINLGLINAGPQQYLRVYETFGRKLHPKLLVVGLFGRNDFSDAELFDRWLISGRPCSYLTWRDYGRRKDLICGDNLQWKATLLAHRSYVYAAMMEARRAVRRRHQSEPEQFWFGDGRRLELDPADFAADTIAARPNRREFSLVVGALRKMHATAKEDGTRMLVVLQPSKEEVYLPLLGEPVSDPSGPLREELSKAGIDYLNLTPVFRQRAAAGEKLFFAVDGHPNAIGYKLIADTLLAHLNKHAERYGLPGFRVGRHPKKI